MAKQLRVLMLYSHSLLLTGLEQRLSSIPSVTIQHSRPDTPDLLGQVQEFHPDVVLLDEQDPGFDVSHIVWQLLDSVRGTRILVLNASERISNLYERHPVTATTPSIPAALASLIHCPSRRLPLPCPLYWPATQKQLITM